MSTPLRLVRSWQKKRSRDVGYRGLGIKFSRKTVALRHSFGVAKKLAFYGRHSVFAQQIEHELNAGSSKQVPLNIDGVMAAVILDMGFEPAVAQGFFIVGRVPGLIAHILEEKRGAAGLRRIDETDIVYE